MEFSFCLWAPWLFALLSGLAGWLLKWWFDDREMSELRRQVTTAENDVYHLNEAHQLLQHDKATKISEFDNIRIEKENEILNLRDRLEEADRSNKSLLAQIVNQKEKPAKIKSIPLSSNRGVQTKISHKKQNRTESKDDLENLKKVVRRKKKIIRKLKAKNKSLSKDANKKATSLESGEGYVILKTRKITEKIDRKKLKKYLENLPIKKSKKTKTKRIKKEED